VKYVSRYLAKCTIAMSRLRYVVLPCCQRYKTVKKAGRNEAKCLSPRPLYRHEDCYVSFFLRSKPGEGSPYRAAANASAPLFHSSAPV